MPWLGRIGVMQVCTHIFLAALNGDKAFCGNGLVPFFARGLYALYA
jgi:hypothetical protein